MVKPSLGGLEWMEGSVPTPYGKIHVEMNQQEIRVFSDGGQGLLVIEGKEYPIPPQQEITIHYD